jgi:hypothetical protein
MAPALSLVIMEEPQAPSEPSRVWGLESCMRRPIILISQHQAECPAQRAPRGYLVDSRRIKEGSF